MKHPPKFLLFYNVQKLHNTARDSHDLPAELKYTRERPTLHLHNYTVMVIQHACRRGRGGEAELLTCCDSARLHVALCLVLG